MCHRREKSGGNYEYKKILPDKFTLWSRRERRRGKLPSTASSSSLSSSPFTLEILPQSLQQTHCQGERERQRNGRKNLPLKLMKIQHFLKGRLKALRPIFDVYQFLKCKTLSNIIWNTNTYMIWSDIHNKIKLILDIIRGAPPNLSVPSQSNTSYQKNR